MQSLNHVAPIVNRLRFPFTFTLRRIRRVPWFYQSRVASIIQIPNVQIKCSYVHKNTKKKPNSLIYRVFQRIPALPKKNAAQITLPTPFFLPTIQDQVSSIKTSHRGQPLSDNYHITIPRRWGGARL